MFSCAVVAAAGLSSRMNDFKPLLPLDGLPAVVRLLQTLRLGGVEHCILVTGYRARELETACAGITGLTFLYNDGYAHTQMFDSARLGFSAVPENCQRVLFTPADIPLVKSETVRSLLNHTAPVLFPSYRRRRGHPIALCRSLLPALCTYEGEGGLRGALETLKTPADYLPVDDPFILKDMDTPDDYRALSRLALQERDVQPCRLR